MSSLLCSSATILQQSGNAKRELISDLKFKLQSVIKNIQILETIKDKHPVQDEVELLKNETAQLLDAVENFPAKKVLKIIKKRKRQRLKQKQEKKILKKITSKAKSASNLSISSVCISEEKPSVIKHQQLCSKYKDAQQYLRCFELLIELHYTRGQDNEATCRFSTKFNDLKTLWSNVLRETKLLKTDDRQVENQWVNVFFGTSDNIFCKAKPNLNDFLRRRKIWDSYVMPNENSGSSIPCGWILPKADANINWTRYRHE